MTVGAEGGRLVVALLCRGAASPVKRGGCAPLLFLVRRSAYVVYYRWRTVSELWYDRRMNENSASSKKKPTPAIVAASMNAGKRGRANGKPQREDNRGGARRNGRNGKRRPLTVRSLDELATRHAPEAKSLGQEIFVTFLKEAFADRRTGNKVYYSRETTLTRETLVPFLCAHRQWRNHEGDFAPDGKLSDLTFGWRSNDKTRTDVARAVCQKLRNARDLTAEEDLYRVSYAWQGRYPDKPNGGYRALVNDSDTAYTLCRVLTGPNAREIARTIVRDTTGEDGSSWFITVMQDLYDNGRYCGIAKSGMFRSLARSYGVNTGADIDSYEAFMKDALENDGKNIKRLFGSGRMTPRVAAMARVANRELGVGYYGKSMWLDIEARRDTWCDTDEKLAEFVSALFEFATPEQVLNWWWHANKYDAGYSRHGAYGDHQGYDRMYWYADAFDREARKRYPFNSEQFTLLYNAGGATMDSYKAKGLEALGCDLADGELYDLFKGVGGTEWHNDAAPFSNRLWWERITNNGEITGLREVAENNAMRPGWWYDHSRGTNDRRYDNMPSAHDWAFLVRRIEQLDASDADVRWLVNHDNVDWEGCSDCSWGSVVSDALWARYGTQGREGMKHMFDMLDIRFSDKFGGFEGIPYGMWRGSGKRPTLDLAYCDAPEAANLWLGLFPYRGIICGGKQKVRTWADTLTDSEKNLLDRLPDELRAAWGHLAEGGEVISSFQWERDYGDDFLNASAAFAVAMTMGHVGADMLSWLGDQDGVRAFMLAHASSSFSSRFPWMADWGRGVHSVPWWVTKGMSGMARAAFLHDVKDSDYMVGVYRDEWIVEAGDAASTDARMAGIRNRVGGISAKVSVGYGVRAFRGRDADKVMVPAGWMQAELAGYWGRMDGLDARTVFARDFLNTLRADLASDVSDEARFPDGFFTLCVPEARKAVEADMARGALGESEGKVMLEELDEVLELIL